MKKIYLSLICSFAFLLSANMTLQAITSDKLQVKNDSSSIYNGLKFRSIGPALMSGRISDIIIHPNNENIWYVTAGSGGVWRTENAGTTWKSVFDSEGTFSIGCITMDPQNTNILWVGTGENVGGRHVAYGDGIYKSEDGGKTWKNMGLKKSEHISKIVIHPTNSNIIWVASQGPLWSKGGERGIYKSIDGGKNWKRTLGDNKWVGATDLLIDFRNPSVLYAATWQRHRTVAGYMGGGPGTGIYKSTDGGEKWNHLTKGLPNSNMGKIGLAMSYQNADIIYAAIELNRRTGGVFKSIDQGASWQKMSDAVAGGTGPHYYQELFTSPHNFDELYLVDNYMQVSFDGGKTFSRMNENEKHVDNHAIAFKKNDPNYLLIGCDGGLYETFDKTKNWKFIDNLPITQFYKIAVDDALPFYNVYGGTQDNNTQGGPSRTDNIHGIRNSDWFVVLGGDGHQPATEPGNPNIVYAQWQRGNLNRHDRITGENVNIKPQPAYGEKYERYNWDSPILVSPHNSTRLYFASQRVWKSEDRGDSWTPISNDLTNNISRVSTSFFGKNQKWDNAWDLYAMSNYSTITSLAESPVKEGLIYAGTDDGVIQVTEDGGKKWRKIDFNKLNELPKTAFVNDIKADNFDENIVYAVFDNHKYGDYKPYIYMSNNKGLSWKKITLNIPENNLIWRIIQDHIDPNLFFIGTEFGVYFTNQPSKKWTKLSSGIPNISVRDLAIQKRENDLIAGTFGRGIYILDDYSSLREFKTNINEAKLFKPRDSYWYKQKRVLGGKRKASQGDNFFIADNPPFGVEFTYFLNEKYFSDKDLRLKNEKELESKNKEVKFPNWDVLDDEEKEVNPSIILYIYSLDNMIIKKIQAINKKGFNRISWDLTSESMEVLTSLNYNKEQSGPMVNYGQYSAKLFKRINGLDIPISEMVFFSIKPLYENSLKAQSTEKTVNFWNEIIDLHNKTKQLNLNLNKLKEKVDIMIKSYERASKSDKIIQSKLFDLRLELLNLNQEINGSESRSKIGEPNEYPTIWSYIWAARSSLSNTYGPTKTQINSINIATNMYDKFIVSYNEIQQDIIPILSDLEKINAPKINTY